MIANLFVLWLVLGFVGGIFLILCDYFSIRLYRRMSGNNRRTNLRFSLSLDDVVAVAICSVAGLISFVVSILTISETWSLWEYVKRVEKNKKAC